jgi:hypothetical protein
MLKRRRKKIVKMRNKKMRTISCSLYLLFKAVQRFLP